MFNMSRRKFFGVAAAAPVAAKETVQKIVETEVSKSGSMLGWKGDNILGGGSVSGARSQVYANGKAGVRAEIKEIIGWWKEAKELVEAEITPDDIRNVMRIDPDLLFNKSFSQSTKLRLQAKRDKITHYESDKSYYSKRLKKLRKKLFEL